MYAFRHGSAWEVLAPAKLNLYLDVLGSRADGFHDLESLLVPVRLYDRLRWVPQPDRSRYSLRIRSLIANQPSLENDHPDNLVLRSAKRLADSAGVALNGTFQLWKRIPMQAGLGGGSSDAAAALVLCNAAWGIHYPVQRLMELAADVGSDVPFFLAGGAAVCRGRGEIVEKTPGLPRLHFVVAKPDASLSTPVVFEQWKKLRQAGGEASIPADGVSRVIQHLRHGNLAGVGNWVVNRLQAAASAVSPIVDRVVHFMARQGFAASAMSGSGTACWGLARSAKHARFLAGRIKKSFVGDVYCISSCSAA